MKDISRVMEVNHSSVYKVDVEFYREGGYVMVEGMGLDKYM